MSYMVIQTTRKMRIILCASAVTIYRELLFNFEPDTGLVSARTLIEYKFLSSASDTKRIAEEILIDSRGYASRDLDTFVYVIYETKRIKSENEWNLLAEKCGFGQNSK
jgi:hypothetical protein